MQIVIIPQPPPITTLQLMIGQMSRDQISQSVQRGRDRRSPVAKSFTGLWTVFASLTGMSTISEPCISAFCFTFFESGIVQHSRRKCSRETRANTKWAVQECVAERSRVTPDDIPVSLTDATNQQLSDSHYLLQKLGSVMEKGIPAGLCIIFVTGHRSIDGVRFCCQHLQ